MAAATPPAGKRTDDGTALLRQVFGDSSDDESECRHGSEDFRFSQDPSSFNPMLCEEPSWDRVKEIDGLWLCRGFLSSLQQQCLLSSIEREGWFAEASHNQAMRFGDLPEWANQLSHSIREAILSAECYSELYTTTPSDEHKQECAFPILPVELLGREPLFDQLIVNLYHPGQGICAHVDLMRFADGIAIISLESPCIMHFSPLEDDISAIENLLEKPPTAVRKIPVYLTPGSLVVMSGEARYVWKHEINRKPGFQMWEGREIEQERRISITLRKLCREEE